MNLTIIIPHLGETKEQQYALSQCLSSLHETQPDIPIVLATNGTEPKYVPLYWNNISRIHLWEQGQCKAVNAAVATTNTEWVMISNDDMIYTNGWLDGLTWMKDYSDCISPRLVEPTDGAPTFIKHFCGGAGGDFDKSKLDQFVRDYRLKDGEPRFVNGFNMPLLIKRELWDLVGGYDINYDPWGSNSDSDLEYKIKLAGVQPLQSKLSLIYHFSQTSGTFNPINHSHWVNNFAYFEQKWGFPRTDEGIWEATFEIPLDKLKYKPKWAKL